MCIFWYNNKNKNKYTRMTEQTDDNMHIDQQEVKLEDLLGLMIAKDASDLHLSVGARIGFRINGKMKFVSNISPLSQEKIENMLHNLMYNNTARVEAFYKKKDVDFGYFHDDGTPFRINAFFKRGQIAIVLRKINRTPVPIADLGLPEAVYKFVGAKQGLVLVTGPTGSGKSTSLTAIVHEINTTRAEHILTIEDPVEFVFESDKSLISQREVGMDTDSFHNALRAAMREDPDIVMIGEMRDEETVMSAINLAETGHLVFSTLHTSGAPQTIMRLVNFFPSHQHHQVFSRIADNLLGILSQRLIKRHDKPGRVGIFELIIVNGAVRNVIRTGDMTQLQNIIQTGSELGMISMERYADNLSKEGIIQEKDYIGFFKEE